jgi:hypothetical protein
VLICFVTNWLLDQTRLNPWQKLNYEGKTIFNMSNTMPGHDPITTERIQRIVQDTIEKQNFQVLRGTTTVETATQTQTIIPPSPLTPIALGLPETTSEFEHLEQLEEELLNLWKLLWDEYGLAAWGFTLFHDASHVYMTGFSSFGFRMSHGLSTYIKMPLSEGSEPFDQEHFFEHVCFPYGFANLAKEKLGIVSSAL